MVKGLSKLSYPDTILRDCGIRREDRQDLWKAMHDKNCSRYFLTELMCVCMYVYIILHYITMVLYNLNCI